MAKWAGTAFASGLYRVHDARSAEDAASLVAEFFTDGTHRYQPFAFDWLGRQFAFDTEQAPWDGQGVFLLEPGSAMVLSIPVNFVDLHDEELVDEQEAALAVSYFDEWRSASAVEEVGLLDCVGYRVPLFLGGADTVDNMSLVDWRVYWDLTGQIYRQVKDVPSGTRIRGAIVSDESRG